jgi:hypothetical protein
MPTGSTAPAPRFGHQSPTDKEGWGARGEVPFPPMSA